MDFQEVENQISRQIDDNKKLSEQISKQIDDNKRLSEQNEKLQKDLAEANKAKEDAILSEKQTKQLYEDERELR